MFRRFSFPNIMICLCVVTLIGCGETGPDRYSVSGTATFDGEPIPEGDMVFVDISGQKSPEGARIANGSFSAQLTAGEKRVEIHAAKDVPGETPPLRESYIPAQYNEETELTATIEPNDSNKLTFDLKP